MRDTGNNKTVTVADLDARAEALNAKRSYIVQAPAGSGKTELLIQRYLRLLATVEKPEEILALTFTRKAATEMRERIISALTHPSIASIVLDNSFSAHERRTLELAYEAQQQNMKCNWGLLENPNRMQIMTIDAFCAQLVQAMPVGSRFGGMPVLEENSEILYRRTVRRYFDQFLQNPNANQSFEELLLELNNNFSQVEDLLVTMLGKREQWLPYVTDQGNIERAQLEEALDVAVYQDIAPLLQILPLELEDELISLVSYAAENLRAQLRESPIRACLGMEKMPDVLISELSKWKGIAALLLTQKGELRQSVTVSTGFPAESSTDDVELKVRYQKFKQRMLYFLEKLENYPEFTHRLKDIHHLPSDNYQQKDIAFLSALFDVLKELSAELLLEFQRSGNVDFIELTHSALRALGTEEDFTDLALIFDSRINHILIDEFQDTSRTHMDLLRKLTFGWAYDGRTLFVVGDPMQSIYRFREAEVRNFLQVKQRGINAVLPEFIQLESNFRSARQVVEWNNRVFANIFPKEDDLDLGLIQYMPSTPVHAASSFTPINLHVTPEKDQQIEALAVVKLTKELLARNNSASVAVLVRSRSHLGQILPYLREEGLIFSTDGMEQLDEQQEVLDLYALTMSLVHLADTYSWLSVLRAPWCGLNLEDLEIIGRAAKDNLVWEVLQDKELMSQLSETAQGRVKYFIQSFRYAYSMLTRESLALVVEGLWLRLHGNSTITSNNQQANVDRYFAILQDFDISNILNPEYSLKEALKKYSGSTDTQQGNVQVMTIHMSKGLEFDHVILPSMNKSTRRVATSLMNWDEVTGLDGNKHLLLSHYQAQTDNDLYQYIKIRNQRQEDAEALRLLYVAFTRAKHSIHVFCGAKAKGDKPIISAPSGSLFYYLDKVKSFMGEIKPFGFMTSEIRQLKMPSFRRQRLLSLPKVDFGKDVNLPAVLGDQNKQVIEYEWASESAMHIGTVVHQALNQLGKGTLEQWLSIDTQKKQQHFRQVLRALGIAKKDLEHAVQKTLTIIQNTAKDEKGKWILSNNHSQIMNELPVSGFIEGKFCNYRIDRTFVDHQGVRWIVDYKTGDHIGSDLEGFLDNEVTRYKGQLENYGHLLYKLEQRPIKLALYFPMVNGWREWDYSSV